MVQSSAKWSPIASMRLEAGQDLDRLEEARIRKEQLNRLESAQITWNRLEANHRIDLNRLGSARSGSKLLSRLTSTRFDSNQQDLVRIGSEASP